VVVLLAVAAVVVGLLTGTALLFTLLTLDGSGAVGWVIGLVVGGTGAVVLGALTVWALRRRGGGGADVALATVAVLMLATVAAAAAWLYWLSCGGQGCS
jgi:hypothetical protein